MFQYVKIIPAYFLLKLICVFINRRSILLNCLLLAIILSLIWKYSVYIFFIKSNTVVLFLTVLSVDCACKSKITRSMLPSFNSMTWTTEKINLITEFHISEFNYSTVYELTLLSKISALSGITKRKVCK